MSVLKVTNVRVLRGGRLEPCDLWVADGRVVDPETRFWAADCDAQHAPNRVVDGRGSILAPGFLDVQINGAFGVDFSYPSVTEQQVEAVARGLLASGVTGFCPTLVSSKPELYARVLPVLRRVVRRQEERQRAGKPADGALILGMHLEGPFISHERHGAHDEAVLRVPSAGLNSLLQCYGDSLDDVAIVTLAPELDGAMQAIRGLVELGVVASAGHSVATVDVAMQAVDNGVSMLTHVFNAMGPFHHRDPGLIGLLGRNDKRPHYGMILDGVHAHPAATRIIERCHPEGLLLVTDAVAGMGLAPGTYDLAGTRMDVRQDAAYVAGTNTLAGSIVTMAECVRRLMRYTDCSVEQALAAASTHQAQLLGGDVARRKGSLSFGADADFVLLDDKLNVVQTYIAGQLVFERASK